MRTARSLASSHPVTRCSRQKAPPGFHSGAGLRQSPTCGKVRRPIGHKLAHLPVMAYFEIVTAEQKSRLDEAVWVNPQRMSGTPCFRGTRVPVQSLIDLLEGGETIDQFLELYPSITRQQVLS